MCGIAGAIAWRAAAQCSEAQLKNMAQPLRFRGPDAQGYHLEQFAQTQIAFAHTRLSIIDLSADGNQPMHSSSSQTTIVFNGEIYNYRELRAELVAAGRTMRTQSDTEVLLEGYEHWGIEELLKRIDGMFAFALYCRIHDTLFLARDRFGKKPLYYYHSAGNQIAFSSDIRSFDHLPRTLDMQALGYFFTELSTPRIDTIWQEVKRVPAAHFMRCTRSEVAIQRYWQLPYDATCTLSRKDILDRTDALLRAAVRRRLVADVRVAAQLSGGIDSSLVVALMAQESGTKISTYSVGFEHDYYNETPFARQVAQQYATDHHELMMRPEDVQVSHDLILEYGEPFADVSMIPSYMISKYISQTEKVVCGGDGGDELFAGYMSYYVAEKLQKVKNFRVFSPLVSVLSRIVPTYRVKFLDTLLRLAKQPEWALLNRNMGFSMEQMRLLAPKGHQELHNGLEREHAALWAEYARSQAPVLKKLLHASLQTRLLCDYLPKVDRASMYASLEMRSPFLDRQLAEFAFTLTPAQLMQPHGTKSVLKQLAERYLPHSLIYRNKQGFGVPIEDWFRKELRPAFEQLVLQGKQILIPIDYQYVARIFGEHAERRQDHTHRLWALYVFHVWAQGQQ